jgi:hypothetical protein
VKTCVLHVGMAKTGTTSIQSTLSLAPPTPGFHYLRSGEANAGRALGAAFMRSPSHFRPIRKLGLDNATVDQMKSAVLSDLEDQLSRPATTFIASSEMLGLFDEASLTRMRDWFERRVDAIRLIAYIREPASYMDSMFQQSLKNGNSAFDVDARYPNYRERFAPMEKVFGRAQITYRAFTPKALVNQCVVRDLMSLIGVDIPGLTIKRINESLSREAVGLLFAYRLHGPKYGIGAEAMRSNRTLIRCLRDVPGERFRLARNLVAPVIEANGPDMAWMAERLGGTLVPKLSDDDDEQAVRGEADLLRFSVSTLNWLHKASGVKVPTGEGGAVDPVAVARALKQLCVRPGRAERKTSTRRASRHQSSQDAVAADLKEGDDPISSGAIGTGVPASVSDLRQDTGPGTADEHTPSSDPEAMSQERGGAIWPAQNLARRMGPCQVPLLLTDGQVSVVVDEALIFLRQFVEQADQGLRVPGLGAFRPRKAGCLIFQPSESSGTTPRDDINTLDK